MVYFLSLADYYAGAGLAEAGVVDWFIFSRWLTIMEEMDRQKQEWWIGLFLVVG